MPLRLAKAALVLALAFYYTLVVFNNLTDYDSNFQFVRHVLMMDSTFPGNRGMWRALNQPGWHTLFYVVTIVWEAVTAILCWWGGMRLALARHEAPAAFDRAKNLAIAGLTLAMLLWLLAFLTVGGEWFLMWQSSSWNGETAAARNFVVVGIVFLILQQREREIGF